MIRAAVVSAMLTLPAAAQDLPGSVPRPVTATEAETLRVAIAQCWNVAALTPEAAATRVTVAVTLDADARPDPASIRPLSHDGPEPEQAYQAARRAILRCGADGFPLPPGKEAEWRNLELNFDPAGMVLR